MSKDPDYGSYAGCMELVEKIKRYWARKGLYPSVWAHKVYTIASESSTPRITYEVTSNMVGGWPYAK